MGAGAELGIYYGGPHHWFVNKKLAMPMTMLVKYKEEKIIYRHDTTWWMTGFNPKKKNIRASDLKVIFTVRFNNATMFNAFHSAPKNIGWTFTSPTHTATFRY